MFSFSANSRAGYGSTAFSVRFHTECLLIYYFLMALTSECFHDLIFSHIYPSCRVLPVLWSLTILGNNFSVRSHKELCTVPEATVKS